MSETFRFTPPPQSASPPPSTPEPAQRPPQEDQEPEYNPQARLDYLHTVNPPKKKRIWLRVLIVLLILALLAGAGVFAYPRYIKKQLAPATTTQATTETKQTATPAEDKVATKDLDSTFFNLSLKYPETWTATENTETSRITVVSPVAVQKTSTGATEQVRTVITIAPKGQNLTAFDKGDGLAIRASEKIKYVSPTPAQRAETYLSFIQYSTTAASSALDGIYITGDNGYQKGQNIPKTDMAGRDPLIAVTFEKCSDTKCSTTPVAVALPSTIWDNESFKAPILTVLTSLAVN